MDNHLDRKLDIIFKLVFAIARECEETIVKLDAKDLKSDYDAICSELEKREMNKK